MFTKSHENILTRLRRGKFDIKKKVANSFNFLVKFIDFIHTLVLSHRR